MFLRLGLESILNIPPEPHYVALVNVCIHLSGKIYAKGTLPISWFNRAVASSDSANTPCSSMENLVSMEQKAVEPPPARVVGEHGAKYTNGLIFVLDKAVLEAAKVGKAYVLLSGDEHGTFLKKHGRDPTEYRPDIVHHALLSILDSPLNKAGLVRAIYIQTKKNTLIYLSPHTRLPRTFRRFCGLIIQLLHKLSMRATNGPDKLLKIVKLPLSRHLPAGAKRLGFSWSAVTLKNADPTDPSLPEGFSPEMSRGLITPAKLADAIHEEYNSSRDVVLVVGGMAHGTIDFSLCDECLAISGYPLSAAAAIARINAAIESKFGIV